MEEDDGGGTDLYAVVVAAGLGVVDAALALGRVAVHDRDDEVALEVLGTDERAEVSWRSRGVEDTAWRTPHFFHRVPSLQEREVEGQPRMQTNGGLSGTYAIRRHMALRTSA